MQVGPVRADTKASACFLMYRKSFWDFEICFGLLSEKPASFYLHFLHWQHGMYLYLLQSILVSLAVKQPHIIFSFPRLNVGEMFVLFNSAIFPSKHIVFSGIIMSWSFLKTVLDLLYKSKQVNLFPKRCCSRDFISTRGYEPLHMHNNFFFPMSLPLHHTSVLLEHFSKCTVSLWKVVFF